MPGPRHVRPLRIGLLEGEGRSVPALSACVTDVPYHCFDRAARLHDVGVTDVCIMSRLMKNPQLIAILRSGRADRGTVR